MRGFLKLNELIEQLLYLTTKNNLTHLAIDIEPKHNKSSRYLYQDMSLHGSF